MVNSFFWWVIIAFMILLDIYVFQAVRMVSQSANEKTRLIIHSIYWGFAVITIIWMALLPFINLENMPRTLRSTLFAIVIGLFFAKIIASTFFLIDDIRRGVQWVAGKIFYQNTEGENISEGGISRSAFLSWAGLLIGGGLFTSLIYGFNNRYRYQLKQVSLKYPNLPNAFKGLKVVQISDIHAGSLSDKAAVMKGIEQIMDMNPDLILFTGDLVNDRASEMDGMQEIFSILKAPLGVFSVLGNHDYGDYAQWESPEAKSQNLDKLKDIHANMGWRLLLNEHVVIEKDNEQIAILGVENWSNKARFPKYGDLSKAYSGSAHHPFKILLSHDPSHWDAEVRTEYKDIDLMLAGHTHGMQFGVEIPGFRWSPVQYVYNQWAGLYENKQQKLYVNRGLGFIGYPGRVGILPEITLIELM